MRDENETNLVPHASFEQLKQSNGYIFRYEEIDEKTDVPTGNSVSFVDVEFEALQYSDLIGQNLNNKFIVPIRRAKGHVFESTISDLPVGKFASFDTVLNSHFSSRAIGLVKGGWLPSGIALKSGMTVMPDRCTVSELFGRFRDGKKTNDDNKDFLDFFVDGHVRINPLLFVLEGNLRANPTPKDVEHQFDEVCAKIKSALPLAEIVPVGRGGLQGVIGIINDTRADMAYKQNFLMQLYPKLRSPVSAKRLPQVWDEVLATADDCNVPRLSLVVIAALSAISVPNGKSPARKLLKLTEPNYSENLAYNALADLRSLEVLMYLFGLYPNERVLLCTGDKDLALFWSGIKASDFEWRDGHLNFRLSPIEALMPNFEPARISSYFGEEVSHPLKVMAP